MVEMKAKRRSTGYLTITVLSAKGLKDVRHFGGLMGTYVTVRLSGKHLQATRKVTSGGGSPKWHEPFDFKLEGWKESMRPPSWLLDADDQSGKFLVEIIHAGLLGQRVVGRRLVNEEDAVDLAQKGFTYHSFGLHGPNGEDVDGYVNLRLEFRPIERAKGGAGAGKAVGEGAGGVAEKKSGVVAAEHKSAAESAPSKQVSPCGTPLASAAGLWNANNNYNKESTAYVTRNSGGSWDDGEKKGNGRKGERRSREAGEIPFSGGWEMEGGGMGVGVVGGGGGGGGLRSNGRGAAVGKGSFAGVINNGSGHSIGMAANGRRFKAPRVHSSTLPFQHPKQVHPDMEPRPDSSNTTDEVGAAAATSAQLAYPDPGSTGKPSDGLDLGWPMRKVVSSLALKHAGLTVADAELPSPSPVSGQIPFSCPSPLSPPAHCAVNTPRGPKNHASLPRVLSHSSPSSDDYDFDPRTYYVAMPSNGQIPPPLYVSRYAYSEPLETVEDGGLERPQSSGRRHSTGGGAGEGGVGGGGGGGSRPGTRRTLSLSRPSGLFSSSLPERRQQQAAPPFVNPSADSSFSFDPPNSNSQTNKMASGGEGGGYFEDVEAEDCPEMGTTREYVGPDSNPGERYESEYGEGEWGDDVTSFEAYAYDNENDENAFGGEGQPHSFAGTTARRTGRGSFCDLDRNDVLTSRSGPLLTTTNKMADFGKRRSRSIKECGYRGTTPVKTRSAMASAVATIIRLWRPSSVKSGGGGKVLAR
ncbi:hypothetical protein CBR_g50957 [Chara braunii]|uniref:C2 domain-containing protein n=1 Tax=Chara braunii TaxID=69332 RepID=A0A388M7Z8_CHABU|nr:hypothetical protein CBR_g50957 [Chara braunii]|eukprot:GBG90613.1 hypothetical protein CBR_g50957 [Chara braunii]